MAAFPQYAHFPSKALSVPSHPMNKNNILSLPISASGHWSHDIVLLPDSTLAAAEKYSIQENAIYPNVYAEDVYTRWHPKTDSLFVNTNGHPVTVLRDQQQFQGNLIQTSKQLAA